MHFDVAIIGAGMSGLAAGIRLAHFGKKVCIFERHTVWGGLNSFYKKKGHHFDTGLHAVTNYLKPDYRGPRVPLQRIFRQLRIAPDAFGLVPQNYSRTVHPGVTLHWDNGLDRLTDEVRDNFASQVDGFKRLAVACETYPDWLNDTPRRSARAMLTEYVSDPLLIDMLLAPLLWYGSAEEHDVDWDQFVTLFNSIYREGFCRPAEGVKRILRTLVDRYADVGGEMRRGNGVASIEVTGDHVRALVMDDGEVVTADKVISSAGFVETMRMRSDTSPDCFENEIGNLAFVETIFVMDRPMSELGVDATITFFTEDERLRWSCPDELVDVRSAVVCCPDNYQYDAELDAHHLRVTHLADWRGWFALDGEAYDQAKAAQIERSRVAIRKYAGDFEPHVVFTDGFTPRTVTRFTSHLRGAIYGSPAKRKTGATDLANLYICGTDQGMLGVVGAMVSGITVANFHGMRA